MFVVNDIDFIMCLRSLNMLDIGEFFFSDVYMTKSFLMVIQKQSILELAQKKKINLFESGNGLYSFYRKSEHIDLQIGLSAMSCVYYAMESKIPLITICPLTAKVANDNGITVYDYGQALEAINLPQTKIDFFLNALVMMEAIANNN